MKTIKKIEPKEIFMGKLGYGCDLYDEITKFCQKKDIRIGRIDALGAVQNARLSFYNQKWRDYQRFVIDRPLEITKLVGNVSIRKKKPFVHVHIILTDETGKAYGGHLEKGTKVFACEIIVESFDGPIFKRDYDKETGLSLWKM
jgi:predicted DNA-binding protein with PD1-like motif